MANDNQPGHAPQHMSSQTVPAGNQTNAAPNSGSLEKQMLELARREKEVRKMQAELKDAVPLSSLRERAQKDRNAVLKELGLDDLIKVDENDPVAALRKQLEDMQKQTADRERAAMEEREFAALKSSLGEKKDDYELISLLGYENQVYEALKNYKSEDGNPPDAYSLAKQIEDTLFNQISSLKESKKVSGLFREQQPAPQRHPLDQNTTLTSSDRTSSQPTQPTAPTVSRHQQIADVAKYIKFND